MKKIIMICLILIALAITSCGYNSVSKVKKEGEMCGGFAGYVCADGLTCKMEGNFPDAAGVCVKAAVVTKETK